MADSSLPLSVGDLTSSSAAENQAAPPPLQWRIGDVHKVLDY